MINLSTSIGIPWSCIFFAIITCGLMDLYSGILPTGNELAERAISMADEALTQIEELKQMVGKPTQEKKTIRMCDGREKVI